MKYMLAFHETPQDFAARGGAAAAHYWQAWRSYMAEMNPVILSGQALEAPETASTLRIRAGQTRIEDGPTPDSKEMLGGFVIIEVPDLDAALAWAAKAPCAGTGAVGVHPVLAMS